MLIEDKILAILLDGIVCQVHIQVVKVGVLGTHVFLCSKTCQTLLIHVDTKWIHSIDKGIDTQIKLQTVNKVRFVKVPLRHVLVTLLQVHVLEAPNEENAFALAKVYGLYNESLVILFLIELLSEVIHFLGEDPCLGKEIVLSREGLMHPHKVATKVVFPSQLVHPREVVNALVWLQLCQLFSSRACRVVPIYIPIAIFIVHHLEPKLAEGLPNNYVPTLGGAQVELCLLLFPFLCSCRGVTTL